MKITPDHLARGAFIYIRQSRRGDSMTRSILTIVLSPASLSGGGIPPSRPYARWRRSWRRCSDSGRRP